MSTPELAARPAPTPRWARVVGALRRRLRTGWPLARGRDRVSQILLRALGRHARAMPARTVFGATMLCNLEDLIQSRVYDYGVWEPNLTAFIAGRLKEGDVFVDVGANVGYYSLLASRLVGPTGRVVSVDASPSIFAGLQQSLAANDARNVRAVNVAIADRRGSLPIYLSDGDNMGRTSVLPDRGGRFEAEVRAAPLTDVVTPDELARARLIKIDVEGAEGGVLAHLLEHTDDFPPDLEIVVEVSPQAIVASGHTLGALLDGFAARGYYWYLVENSYDDTSYRSRAVVPPVRGSIIPDDQADLVLSRTRAPSLSVTPLRGGWDGHPDPVLRPPSQASSPRVRPNSKPGRAGWL